LSSALRRKTSGKRRGRGIGRRKREVKAGPFRVRKVKKKGQPKRQKSAIWLLRIAKKGREPRLSWARKRHAFFGKERYIWEGGGGGGERP